MNKSIKELNKLVNNKSMVNTSTIESSKMTWKEYEQQLKHEHDIQILSRIVGTTFFRKMEEWDTTRQLYVTFYEAMKVKRVVLEIDPAPHVMLEFNDDRPPAICSTIEDFSCLIGKAEHYGSIKEMLVSEDFSFGKL